MTGKELTGLCKANETPDGSPVQFEAAGAVVSIESVYIGGTGAHRAWKRLYYVTLNGKKMGGYDRRDSFVQWAVQKLREAA